MAESCDGSNVKDFIPKKQKPTIFSLRCRLCRTHLLTSDKMTSFHGTSPDLCGNCLYLDEDDIPSWIQNEIELSCWTKGRIYCPKQHCTARVGGFDFVKGVLCACGVFTIPAIWIQDGKVDVNLISKLPEKSAQPSIQTLSKRLPSATQEKKNGISLALDTKSDAEVNVLLSEANSTDSKSSEFVGIVPIATNSLMSKDEPKKASDEGRNDLKFDKTGRHSNFYRSTSHRPKRDIELDSFKNRFGHLEVEEPIKPVPRPSPKEAADRLTCPICLECFYKPYQCPCDHVFCEPCLRQLYNARSGTLKCPVCRRPVRYIEPAYELREELQNFHLPTTKARERYENSAKYKRWPLPPTDPLAVLKKRKSLVPSRDQKLIKSAGILLFIVCFVILYIGLNLQ